MKKTLLSTALLAASASVAAGDYYNGRLTGMSGAGYATGGYADGLIHNPSLGAAFQERDNFALVVNVGALGEDEDDLLDGLEDLADYLDSLEQRTTSYPDYGDINHGDINYGDINYNGTDYSDPNSIEDEIRRLQQDEADEAISQLEKIADRTANISAGTSLVLSIPNNWLSLSLVGRVQVQAAVSAVVDEEDYGIIRDFVGETDFDAGQLESYGVGRGAIVGELGLAMAKSLKTGEDSKLLLGVTPKYVHVSSFIYRTEVDDFDSDDFDADDYTVDTRDTNVDLGATYISGNMHYAVTVNNALSRRYETVDPNETLRIKARTTTAVGYKNDWFTAEAAVDLNSSPNFATDRQTQYARAGIELNGWNWVQLRAGVQHDLEGNVEDTYSVGAGFSPFNIVNIDVAGFVGEGNALGGAMQMGLRF